MSSQSDSNPKFNVATLQYIVDAIPSGVMLVDREGLIVLANTLVSDLFGYAHDELPGRPLEILVPHRYRADHRRHCERFFAASQRRALGVGQELYGLQKDGREIPLEIGLNPVAAEDGDFVLVFVADISFRKQRQQERDAFLAERNAELESQRLAALNVAADAEEARQRLERANEELRFAHVAALGRSDAASEKSTIVRETGDEVPGIVNFDDALDAWARQARDLIGAHQSAVSYFPHGNIAEGKHAISLSDKYEKYRTYDVLPTGEGIWSIVIKDKVSFCMTDEELKSHPAWKNFSDMLDARGLEHPPMRGWVAVPVLGRDAEFVGFLQLSDKYEGDFTADDLQRATRLAQLMAPSFSLQFANEQLQGSNQKLADANSALKQSNADLQQFAYVASHDLQEPLRAVFGYCQLLEAKLQDQLDGDAKEYLTHATAGAKRMQDLIQSLLDYARIESRGKPLEAVDVSGVLDAALANLAVAIRDAQATVTVSDMPTVPADRGQLIRLFHNLIGNAIKFRSDRAPKIAVSVAEDADQWRFTVSDNGIGIEPQYAERIFVIFQRLHTRDKYPGTGLGLAIAKRIVERHGGRIWLESHPGEGSTFQFTIPKTSDS